MSFRFRFLGFTFTIVSLFISHHSFSQIRFGPKAGLLLTELPNNTRFITKQKIHPGYAIGAVAEAGLSDRLFIQPGVQLSNRGSGYTAGNTIGGNPADFPEFSFSALYADVSANLLYKPDILSDKFFVLAGPQVGYGLSGKWKTSHGTTSEIHFGTASTDDYKPIDYGINIGAGVEIGNFEISSQYYFSLSTVSASDPPLEEQKYKAVNIAVTYLFMKEKKKYKAMDCRYLYVSKKYKTQRKYNKK